MKLSLPLKFILLFNIVISLNSCVKDGDFALEDNGNGFSVVESNLIDSSLTSDRFDEILSQEENRFLTDTLTLDFQSNGSSLEQMSEANLSFKFINTLNVAFKMDLEFINDTDELKYKVHVPISKGSVNDAIHVETLVSIEEPEIENFKEATKLIYKISLSDNSKQLVFDSNGSIALQSKVIFVFESQ